VSGNQRAESRFTIERATRYTPELAEAMGGLMPQLSPGRPPPSDAELAEILSDDRVHVFVARLPNGTIHGAITLVFYRVLTGLRARIEDLVVARTHRGLGLGKALMQRAMEAAREGQAHVLDLTSNASRAEANRLYLTLGFQRWETNVYRKVLDEPGQDGSG
jgi:GNAT superfamily N-acetyltransferase